MSLIRFIRALIDRTTMYRLVLYYLLVLFAAAVVFGFFGVLPYAPLALLYTAGVLLIAAWVTNEVFAWLFGVKTNHESAIITALILALILPPVIAWDGGAALLLSCIAGWAVASKYLVSLRHKHIFNPAAFAVALSAYFLGVPATWWVGGTLALLPFALIGGLAIVYKIRRFGLFFSFAFAALLAVAATSVDPLGGIQAALLHSAFFFLAFAMLTEPLTMPPTRPLRILYGLIVGFLFAPNVHVGSLYLSPELALLVGNAFSFIVSPKGRHRLTLVGRTRLAEGVYEFVFRPDRRLFFRPGQYLEWTLGRVPFDSRGNRRYFTIASAPEDEHVRLGIRFYELPSGFKRALANLSNGGALITGSLAGDFTLPRDAKKKLAFLAGGIGVTPFASMARHQIAAEEARDAVLLYASRTAQEIAYKDVFAAATPYGLKTTYVLSDEPASGGMESGLIDAARIAQKIPDYRERLFYVSGPPGMVDAMRRHLRSLGVSRTRIRTDYFPGLA